MAIIRKKPKPPAVAASSVDVDALIDKGGSVAMRDAASGSDPEKMVRVALRIPSNLVDEVDDSCRARRVPTSRNHWILEAIVEKLEREQAQAAARDAKTAAS
jgi:hypothetical protein